MAATGVCPRMSNAQQGMTNCKGDKCALWDEHKDCCSEVSVKEYLGEIAGYMDSILTALNLMGGIRRYEDGT